MPWMIPANRGGGTSRFALKIAFIDSGSFGGRLRLRRSQKNAVKQKRHGKLAAADRDLLFEAQRGRLAFKPPKNNTQRISKEDAIKLWQGCENIDWRCVVADQHGLQTTYKELLAESGDTNNGRKSESLMVGEDFTLSDLQLKQH